MCGEQGSTSAKPLTTHCRELGAKRGILVLDQDGKAYYCLDVDYGEQIKSHLDIHQLIKRREKAGETEKGGE